MNIGEIIMGAIMAIVNWFKGLFGGSSENNSQQALSYSSKSGDVASVTDGEGGEGESVTDGESGEGDCIRLEDGTCWDPDKEEQGAVEYIEGEGEGEVEEVPEVNLPPGEPCNINEQCAGYDAPIGSRMGCCNGKCSKLHGNYCFQVEQGMPCKSAIECKGYAVVPATGSSCCTDGICQKIGWDLKCGTPLTPPVIDKARVIAENPITTVTETKPVKVVVKTVDTVKNVVQDPGSLISKIW